MVNATITRRNINSKNIMISSLFYAYYLMQKECADPPRCSNYFLIFLLLVESEIFNFIFILQSHFQFFEIFLV